jgi:cytochrome c oxidase subunit 6b
MIVIPETLDTDNLSGSSFQEREKAGLSEEDKQFDVQISEYVRENLSTAPYDPRFPNQNQSKHCWQNFVDYQRCIRAKGEEFSPCQHFKYLYNVMCPPSWVDAWDELISEGRFPANLTPPVPK